MISQHIEKTMTASTDEASFDNEESGDFSPDAIPTFLTQQTSMGSIDQGRRLSRSSIQWFQKETAVEVTDCLPENLVPAVSRRRSSGLIGGDGKLRDDFILQRQNINRPMQTTLKTTHKLVDLEASEITTIDGYVLSQLFLSGYAKMSSRIQELNKINGMLIVIFETRAVEFQSHKTFPFRFSNHSLPHCGW